VLLDIRFRAAYAFVEAIVVVRVVTMIQTYILELNTSSSKDTLGALSVVICAILSSIFLKETLTFFGWLGCALCIVSPPASIPRLSRVHRTRFRLDQ